LSKGLALIQANIIQNTLLVNSWWPEFSLHDRQSMPIFDQCQVRVSFQGC